MTALDAALEQAARELATTTPMPLAEARKSLARALTADEKADVSRFGIHDEPETESSWDPPTPATEMSIEAFLIDQNITRAELREILREYRSETGYSPYEWGERDTLDAQFLTWHRWERLA